MKAAAEQLTMLHHLTKTDPDPRVRRRAQMVLQVGEGQSVGQVATHFHTGPSCVRRWQERFTYERRQGLRDRPLPGRPGKLSGEDRQFLVTVVEQPPCDQGLPTTSRTFYDLQGVLGREREVRVSDETVQRILHRLVFRFRRPRHDLIHRQDPGAVVAAQHLLHWLKKSRTPGERLRLVFVDECAIHIHLGLAKIWQRRGQPVKIPAAGEDQKCTVFGTVEYASGQVLWQISPQKSGEVLARFLDTLATTFPDKTIIVVLDNASYHKSQELREHWRRLALHMTPFWPPVYASQLDSWNGSGAD